MRESNAERKDENDTAHDDRGEQNAFWRCFEKERVLSGPVVVLLRMAQAEEIALFLFDDHATGIRGNSGLIRVTIS